MDVICTTVVVALHNIKFIKVHRPAIKRTIGRDIVFTASQFQCRFGSMRVEIITTFKDCYLFCLLISSSFPFSLFLFASFSACEWVGKQIKKCFGGDQDDEEVKGKTCSGQMSDSRKRKMAEEEGKVYRGLESNSYEYG